MSVERTVQVFYVTDDDGTSCACEPIEPQSPERHRTRVTGGKWVGVVEMYRDANTGAWVVSLDETSRTDVRKILDRLAPKIRDYYLKSISAK